MRLPIWIVDAFASRAFEGNPAAVVLVDAWPGDDAMRRIAAENAQPTTAFVRRDGGAWGIRWFREAGEMDLCGHATLAAAWVALTRLPGAGRDVRFSSRAGPVAVGRDGGLFVLDLPARPAVRAAAPEGLAAALGRAPAEVLVTADPAAGICVAVYEREDEVRGLSPDFVRVAALDVRAVIVTAPGVAHDFVSRYFAPRSGAPEDAVTGSAHCALTPFWARRLGRDVLRARQVSARGGELRCTDRGGRVLIAGAAAGYLEGTIEV